MPWNFPQKKTWLSIGIAGILLLTCSLKMCATFPRRNLSFEERIQQFADRRVPGSQFDLFNGRDLSGWAVHGFGRWTVDDGVLTVRRGIGYLATRCETFDDFILTCRVRVSRKGNSGIFFRADHPGFGFRPWPVGYEAQVDHHDSGNCTGSLYDRQLASKLLTEDGEWFEMTVSAIGSTIQIQVNGETVVDCTNTDYRRGFIALQAHGPTDRVDFRDIRIRIPEKE